ncbi:hypothetical protein [Pseudonocardia parietis]|uniref:Nitrile hydratase beta subunit n=1 Tax=Pseudonocardia parietis TaxID=570936 RepID=A0ABS4W4Y7_9PSEU|nr:hypothetical protein [Pseudonocardia parietis]MBP2370689.1 hypothetical protein [Pseudonocardia parietis]
MTTTRARRLPQVGDVVRIERDAVEHPSRGTWPSWHGRIGTVVVVNADRRPDRTEYGVTFGTVRARADRDGAPASSDPPVWFLAVELLLLGAATSPTAVAA